MTTVQDCSIGIGLESTYNTKVTPTRTLEFLDENFQSKPDFKVGQGLRVGRRFPLSSRRVRTENTSDGDITVEAATKGLGPLLKACFGTGTSTVVSGSTYQQLFTPGDTLPSLTVQKGIPRQGGIIDPYTYPGCVVKSWSLSAKAGEILELKVEFDGGGAEDTATSLTAVSYASSPSLFHFSQGALVYSGGTLTAPTTTALATYSAGTAAAYVTEIDVNVDNKLTGGSVTLGAAGVRGSSPVPGVREGKGSIKVDHGDVVLRDLANADTELGLLLTFTSSEALSTGFATMQVLIPAVKIMPSTPKSNKGEVVEVDYEFEILSNPTFTYDIYGVIRTADTAL